MMNLISEDYLMHYGVKGMKWGVRHDKPTLGQRFSNNATRMIEKKRARKMEETKRYANTKYGKWVRDVSNRNYDRASAVAKKAGNGLSDKQKKILKGAAVGAAAVAAGALTVAALKSGAGKAAVANGAKYLRMAKTDAKIMKIGVKDAVSNSRAVLKGKQISNNLGFDRKVRMAKTDAKILKIGAKDAASRTADRTLDALDTASMNVGNAYRSAKYDAGKRINEARTSAAKKLYKAGNKVAPKRNTKRYNTYMSSRRTDWKAYTAVPKYKKNNVKVLGKR